MGKQGNGDKFIAIFGLEQNGDSPEKLPKPPDFGTYKNKYHMVACIEPLVPNIL